MKRLLMYGILGVLAGAGVAWAGTQTIDQKNLKFSMSVLKVAPGHLVEFDNSDDTPHNVTIVGNGLLLNSGLQAPGQSFSVRLIKPGVYTVSCGIHPHMKMIVLVE